MQLRSPADVKALEAQAAAGSLQGDIVIETEGWKVGSCVLAAFQGLQKALLAALAGCAWVHKASEGQAIGCCTQPTCLRWVMITPGLI